MWIDGWKRTVVTGGIAMVLSTAMFGCDLFGKDKDKDDRRNDRQTNRVDRTSGVPDSARVVAEGRSRDLSYRADNDGRLYLYDASNERLISSWKVEKGQRFTVSPDNNAISLDGREVSSGTAGALSSRSSYRLLFDEKD